MNGSSPSQHSQQSHPLHRGFFCCPIEPKRCVLHSTPVTPNGVPEPLPNTLEGTVSAPMPHLQRLWGFLSGGYRPRLRPFPHGSPRLGLRCDYHRSHQSAEVGAGAMECLACCKKAPTKTPTKDSDTVGVEKTGQLQRVAFGERYNQKIVGRHTAVQTVVCSPASLQPRMRLRPDVGRVTSDQRSWSRFFYERGSV